MNLPSLSYIYRSASGTVRRFPLVLISSSVAAFCAAWIIDLSYTDRQHYDFLYKLISVAVLGIPLFTALVLTVEKAEFSESRKWGSRILGLALLIIYYFSLPDGLFDAVVKHGIRFALFFLGVHLMVAIAPFWKKGEINGFWQYNKSLFLRFLTAVLYSHVLYLGLVIAMLSVDNLFNIDLPDEWYGQLWVLILGIFNTWFFLSGIPQKLHQLEEWQHYPKGLKIFTQYILIPLVIVYLVILYLYAGKIVIEWEWPEGWVAILILSFSIAGIFSLLLLYPIQEKVENRWIKSFSSYYYKALIPLVFMLLLAIWRRISEYGFTENRYFVLILGLWLAGIVIYFVFSSEKSIKVIPGTLCIISFLISFGPWGAFSISESSQINRLESLLQKNELLAGGTIQRASGDVPFEDAKEISAIVRYLSEVHGFKGIEPWFDRDIEKIVSTENDSVQHVSGTQLAQEIVEAMGITYVNRWDSSPAAVRNFAARSSGKISIDPYDWLITTHNFYSGRDTLSTVINDTRYLFKVQTDSSFFEIFPSSSNGPPLISTDLNPFIERLVADYSRSDSYNIPQHQMTIVSENESAKINLLLKSLNVQKTTGRWGIQNAQIDIFIKIKE